MFKTWLTDAEKLVKNAGVKVAADQAAMSIADPTDKGTVSIPDCGDGSNRTGDELRSDVMVLCDREEYYQNYEATYFRCH